MSNIEQLHCVKVAIDLTNQRLSKGANKELYEYILNQLNYIDECINDKSVERDKLAEVNIGQLAVREFEPVDSEYSEALKKAYFIVHYMKSGLKVPSLDEHGNIIK